MKHALVIATTNHGKLTEFRQLLRDMNVDVLSVRDVSPRPIHVIEDGKTFADNALKKAREVAALTSMLTLADDSGLEVDALHGAPGVRSARFAGERATDAENNAALLSALDALSASSAGARAEGFKARFRCVLALVDPFSPTAETFVVEGACEGTITRVARGSSGFGYDPLFLVDGMNRTMAELSEAEKNTVSHRARAMQALRLTLEKVLTARNETLREILA
jgi:XTP/dITP diphosphohydrolase